MTAPHGSELRHRSQAWYRGVVLALQDGDRELAEQLVADHEGIDPVAVQIAETRLAHHGSNVSAIVPHYGPQWDFVASGADVVVYGGQAGGAKTFGLLLCAARHCATTPRWTSVIFRRTLSEAKMPGGLVDESRGLYGELASGPRFNEQHLNWSWANGSRIKLGHLQHPGDEYAHKGAQYGTLCFDELTSFTEAQFFYLLSRNRVPVGRGPRAHCRATTNPDRDSWVFGLLRPWVDSREGEDACPLWPTPPGTVRWFRRFEADVTPEVAPYVLWRDGSMVWVLPGCPLAKSITYIPAALSDNPSLGDDYRASLEAQSAIERARLLGGDWLARAEAGTVFRREWWTYAPHGDLVREATGLVRAWDLATAAVASGRNKAPDHAVGVLMGRLPGGRYAVLDVVRQRGSSAELEELLRTTAASDGSYVRQLAEQLPAAAGKWLAEHLARVLAGFPFESVPSASDKLSRALPLSAAVEQRKVVLPVGAPWAAAFVAELEAFPGRGYDDQVDAATLAFHKVAGLGASTGPAVVFAAPSPMGRRRKFW